MHLHIKTTKTNHLNQENKVQAKTEKKKKILEMENQHFISIVTQKEQDQMENL
jgi:predicted nucleic-acid-binding Zn-ribbon protein